MDLVNGGNIVSIENVLFGLIAIRQPGPKQGRRHRPWRRNDESSLGLTNISNEILNRETLKIE